MILCLCFSMDVCVVLPHLEVLYCGGLFRPVTEHRALTTVPTAVLQKVIE